jgi:quinone-modifying oxidoreductase subunit QmoC
MSTGGSESTRRDEAGRDVERIMPDRELLCRLRGSGAENLRACMQCATCSSVCELTDGCNPAPRKEMLWAQWGLRDRLMGDVDLWLCHQCGDCTLRCPRGARPGDVMSALRRECVVHYSVPRAVGRWVNRPWSLPWIVVGSTLLLTLAAALWPWSGPAVADLTASSDRVALSFWSRLPYGLLVTFFSTVVLLDAALLLLGARRLWRAMHDSGTARAPLPGTRSVGASWLAALRRAVWHDDFGLCAESQSRRLHHLLVVLGMVALVLTDLWVVTARYNPLLQGLVYPLGFFNPWKVMANLGGVSVVLGATLMLRERWVRPDVAGGRTYSDFVTLGLLLAVVLTGFGAEAIHFARIEPLRYIAYAAHLVSVLALFAVLPYSKLAHIVYRTVAVAYAERVGRRPFRRSAEAGRERERDLQPGGKP